MKCLHCEAIIPVSTLSYFIPAVYYINSKDGPFPRSCTICDNGHAICVYEEQKNKFIIIERDWCYGLPGRLSHVRLWVNNEWTVHEIRNYGDPRGVRDIYVKNQKERKYQISESRKMWLLCAKRLGLVPDVRKLIGKMMNLEPFEYWKEKEDWNMRFLISSLLKVLNISYIL
mgnify:CR=1 FL=1